MAFSGLPTRCEIQALQDTVYIWSFLYIQQEASPQRVLWQVCVFVYNKRYKEAGIGREGLLQKWGELENKLLFPRRKGKNRDRDGQNQTDMKYT